MKSIKPGRGPSMIGGIVGIFMILIGIVWTVMAAQMSIAFSLFGVVWTAIAVINTVYNFKNATGKNRFSSFDITDDNEEPDPFNERFGEHDSQKKEQNGQSKFCPYCGIPVEGEYEFCNKCGKKLP